MYRYRYVTPPTPCNALFTFTQPDSPSPTLLHLLASPTPPTPPIQPCAGNKSTLSSNPSNLHHHHHPRRHLLESLVAEAATFFQTEIVSSRGASGATVDANPSVPRYLRTRTVPLSLSLRSSPLKREERSWVWSRISRCERARRNLYTRRAPFFSRDNGPRLFSTGRTGHLGSRLAACGQSCLDAFQADCSTVNAASTSPTSKRLKVGKERESRARFWDYNTLYKKRGF